MDEQSKLARLGQLYFLRFGDYPPLPVKDDMPINKICELLSDAISKLIPLKDGDL